jgi:hypothetical protein
MSSIKERLSDGASVVCNVTSLQNADGNLQGNAGEQTCGPATLDTCNNNSIQFFILMCCTNSQMANYRYSTNKQNNNNKDKVLVTTSQKTNFN